MKVTNLVKQKQENLEIARRLAEQVNPLVEKAFGEGFRGDYEPSADGYSRGKGLGFIARKGSLWQQFLKTPSGAFIEAGHFFHDFSGSKISLNERDGSVITVEPKYESQAKAYAELYKSKFNKEVLIRIDDIFDYTPD